MTTGVQWSLPALSFPRVGVPSFLRRFSLTSTVAVESSIDIWSERGLPAWVYSIIEQFEPILSLKAGWTEGKGRPVTSEAFQASLRVLEETMARDTIAPSLVPTSDGGLQLEWHCAGVDLEVYVEYDGRVSAWCREGGREWEEDSYPRARLTKELSLLSENFCR